MKKFKGIVDLIINTPEALITFCDGRYYYIDGVKSNYIITPDGNVYSMGRGKLKRMKPVKQSTGYYLLHFHMNGKSYYRWHHRAVAETFIENDDPEHKTQVNHIDGNKKHNYVSNLEWCTPKENVSHAFRTNLRKSGEGSSHVKLTEDTVRKICKLLEKNELTMHDIADKLNVDYHLVFFIRKKKTWTDVSCEYNIDNFNKFSSNRGYNKLTEDDIHAICKEILEDKTTMHEIAKKYGVHEHTIQALKACRTWKDITTKYFKSHS